MVQYFLFSKWTNLSEDIFIQYLSVAGIKTLNKLFIPLLMHIYEQDIQKITYMVLYLLFRLAIGC